MVIWSFETLIYTDEEMLSLLIKYGFNPAFKPVELCPKLRVHRSVYYRVAQ